jgi:hypothetical protein
MQLLIINHYNMKKLLSIALLFVSLNVFAQSIEEKVWKRVEELTKAVFETKDSIALEGLVNKYVTYAHSSGVVEDRPTMIHAAVSSPLKYKNISIERGTINIDGKTAVLRHNLRGISVDERGTESPLNLGILQVWKKNKGKWQIWARQAVRINPRS